MTGHGTPSGGEVDADATEAAYDRDGGLAAERTELAWSRSTLALLACGAALVRGFPKITGNAGHPLAGALLLALGGAIWLLGLPYARARAAASRTGQRHRATARELAPLAFGTAAVGVAAIVIDLLLPR